MAAAEEAGGEGGAEGKAAAKKGGKGAKAGKRFEIKKWNAVAMWSWAICTGASLARASPLLLLSRCFVFPPPRRTRAPPSFLPRFASPALTPSSLPRPFHTSDIQRPYNLHTRPYTQTRAPSAATTCTSRRSSTRPTRRATPTTPASRLPGAPAATCSTWTASSAGSRRAAPAAALFQRCFGRGGGRSEEGSDGDATHAHPRAPLPSPAHAPSCTHTRASPSRNPLSPIPHLHPLLLSPSSQHQTTPNNNPRRPPTPPHPPTHTRAGALRLPAVQQGVGVRQDREDPALRLLHRRVRREGRRRR